MRERMEQFMAGRYGVDELAKWSLGAAVVVMVLNLVFRIPVLNTLIFALFVWIYYRMFSRQVGKRYAENQKFLELLGTVRAKVLRQEQTMKDLRTNHIFRCPSCGQKIRVPRGRGKIAITCPKCRNEFIKKS